MGSGFLEKKPYATRPSFTTCVSVISSNIVSLSSHRLPVSGAASAMPCPSDRESWCALLFTQGIFRSEGSQVHYWYGFQRGMSDDSVVGMFRLLLVMVVSMTVFIVTNGALEVVSMTRGS